MKTCTKCGFVGEDELFLLWHNRCKKCQCEYYKNRRINNPEKIKEYDKNRRINNIEKLRIYSKIYRENNIEKARENVKKHYYKDIEKSRLSGRLKYHKYKEKRSIYAKKYYAENIDKRREYSRIYNAKNIEKHKDYSKNVVLKLTDNYIACQLRNQMNMKGIEVPIIPELFEIKRLQIRMKRIIRNQNKLLTT